jgi:hypothetical protein
MAQRDTPCGVSLGVCRVRITQLDPITGCIASAADNSFVLGNTIKIDVTPNKDTGADTTLIDGCGCKIATYKAPEILKRYDLTLTTPIKSAALESILTGGDILYDNSVSPVPVGFSSPTNLTCDESQVPVAMEFWSKNWIDGAQDSALPWIHWTFPYTIWSPGPASAQNDFAQPDFVGFTRGNTCWGDGPYGDGPDTTYGASSFDTSSDYYWFYTPTDPPTASCDLATVAPAS